MQSKSKFNKALKYHQAGRWPEAERAYREITADDPALFEAHVNLGVVLHEQGRLDAAGQSYRQALALNPDFAEVNYALGTVLLEQGDKAGAEAGFRRALDLRADYPEALNGLGIVLQKRGHLADAIESLERALKINPNFAEAHNNIGNVFRENDQYDEAVRSYREALNLMPNYAEAYNNIGKTLKSLNKLDEAMASFQEAIKLKPDFSEAYGGLGLVLNGLGQFQESLAQFEIKLAYERGKNPINPNHPSLRFITKPKIDHDIEQFRYLASLGNGHEHFNGLADTYEALKKEIDWSNSSFLVPLSDENRQLISETYNRTHHVVEAPRIPGGAINSGIDVAAVTREYFNNSPGMVYFDGLLTAEALASLRRFLLESTIWFDIEHSGGYLGTYLNDGLACPLILQIAEELRLTFPEIFQDHRLNQLWAYKYDSYLQGIPMHADFAAININFWVTPNTANKNPDHGGLVVYDVEAPSDWHFKSYNTDVARMKKYLSDNNSGKMVIPHAENRAVMFNSDLFHETDLIDFEPEYENRRLNITLLYGQRSS